MARVFIPAQWRDLTGGVAEIDIEASTVRQVIAALESRYPGIAERACEHGEIASALAVSVGGNISSRGMRTPVARESEVHFLPAIGGG